MLFSFPFIFVPRWATGLSGFPVLHPGPSVLIEETDRLTPAVTCVMGLRPETEPKIP